MTTIESLRKMMSVDVLRERIDAEVLSRQDGDAQTLASSTSYTDERVSDAVTASQMWLPAVSTVALLPSPADDRRTYLCRVTGENNVYQRVAGQSSWALYSENTDYVDELELANAMALKQGKSTDDFMFGNRDGGWTKMEELSIAMREVSVNANLKLRVSGNMVTLYCKIASGSASDVTIGTVPTLYAPEETLIWPYCVSGANGNPAQVWVKVTSAGVVSYNTQNVSPITGTWGVVTYQLNNVNAAHVMAPAGLFRMFDAPISQTVSNNGDGFTPALYLGWSTPRLALFNYVGSGTASIGGRSSNTLQWVQPTDVIRINNNNSSTMVSYGEAIGGGAYRIAGPLSTDIFDSAGMSPEINTGETFDGKLIFMKRFKRTANGAFAHGISGLGAVVNFTITASEGTRDSANETRYCNSYASQNSAGSVFNPIVTETQINPNLLGNWTITRIVGEIRYTKR